MEPTRSRRSFSYLEIALFVLLVSLVGVCVFLVMRSQNGGEEYGAPDSPGRDPESAAYSDSFTGRAGEQGGGTSPESGAKQMISGENAPPLALPGRDNPLPESSAGFGETEGQPARATDSPAAAGGRNESSSSDPSAGILTELERLAGLPWGPDTEKSIQAALLQLAAIDPVAAIDYALGMESRRAGEAAVGAILNNWAARDTAAAYAWCKEHMAERPQLVSTALQSIFSNMAKTDPDAALRALWELPQQNMRNSDLRAVVAEMSANDQQDRLLQYYNTLPDTASRAQLAAALVDQWAVYYPDKAAAWVSGLTDPEVRRSATLELISKWAYDNPAQAVQWVAGLPQDENWSAGAGRLVEVWARQSPDKAANWLLGQSPPAARLDQAVQSLVGAVMNSNPEGAMAWAEVIVDTRRRHSQIQRVGSIWMRQDPERAAAYILGSDLPNSVKRRLLRAR